MQQYHVVGNHDLALPRPQLHAALRRCSGGRCRSDDGATGWYYSVGVAAGWRVIGLDTLIAVSTACNGWRWPDAAQSAATAVADD